jgi:serine/threonine-protein kinase RsbW
VPDVRVRVPAHAQFLQVLRHTVVAIAARAGCSIDVLADLRLAVDEAATRLLRDVLDPEELLVEAARSDGGLRVTVSVASDDTAWPPAALEASMGWTILAALVLDAEATRTAVGPAISFRVATDG